MVPIVEAIIKAYGATVEFANGVMESMDEKKFAEAVEKYYGEEPSEKDWDEAIELIKNATDIDTERKLELINMVSEKRRDEKQKALEEKQKIVNSMDEHNEKKAKWAVQIVTGVLTAGVSLIPTAAKEIKKAIEDPEGKTICEDADETVIDIVDEETEQ